MSYEQRLKLMVEKGIINHNEAKAFQESLEKLPSSENKIKRPLPLAGLAVSFTGIFILCLVFIIISMVQGSAATQTPQNIQQSLNMADATGDIGLTAAALMAVFLLFALPFSGILMFFVSRYNTLIGCDEAVKKTESFIKNTLQRRRNLVPDLQELIRQIMVFEETTHSTITEQRHNRIKNLNSSLEILSDDANLLPGFSAVAEAYPDLKANSNVLALQAELSRIEQELLIARNIHSQAIADANFQMRTVFGSLAASMAGVNEKYYASIT